MKEDNAVDNSLYDDCDYIYNHDNKNGELWLRYVGRLVGKCKLIFPHIYIPCFFQKIPLSYTISRYIGFYKSKNSDILV